MLDIQHEVADKRFELVMYTRDSNGNPKRRLEKSFDSGSKMAEFYNIHKGKPKRKKKNKAEKSSLPKKEQAETLLSKVNKYAEDIAKKREGNDGV